MKNLILPFSFFVLLSSCSENVGNVFTPNFELVKNPPKISEVISNKLSLQDSLSDVRNMYVAGDKLVLKKYGSTGGILSVYDLNGHFLDSFGSWGNAKDEFTKGMSLTNQTDGDFLFVNDVNTAALKVVDLNASLDSGKCVLHEVYKTAPRAMYAFLLDDSTIVYEQEVKDNYRLYFVDAHSGKIKKKTTLFDSHTNPFYIYDGQMVVNRKEGKLALVMRFMNQVNFMSLHTDWRKATSLYENPNQGKDIPWQYYCSAAADDNFVYALYMNQSADNAFEKSKKMEIHVFDWEGNLCQVVPTDEYIVRIAVDSNGNLYGKDMESRIYRYSLHN